MYGAPKAAKGNEGKVHGVEHELDGHEDGDDVAFKDESDGAESEEDGAQNEVILRRDHAIFSPAGRGRARP